MTINMSNTPLCSPVVRANPLAQSDVAAAALPPNIVPIHVKDVSFSLESAFESELDAVHLDLGPRAARIPVPYAIRLRIVDRKGPIRPIEARIQRFLEGPQSMFLSVIDRSNITNMPTALNHSLEEDERPNETDESSNSEFDDNNDLIEDTFYAFWAAPDTFTEKGHGRLLVSVTDSEYTDYEIPINISVQTTRPVISVEAPGYAQREIRTETNVKFSDFDHNSDALITVWNETEGGAPLLINIVLEDNAGGAFSIGRSSDDESTCIPILLEAGRSESFRARFSMTPTMTLRRCYYGSVLIKYAFVLQSQGAPGHDLELNQYYDHVVNLTASLSSTQDHDSNSDSESRDSSMDSGIDCLNEARCTCSDSGDLDTCVISTSAQANPSNNTSELSVNPDNKSVNPDKKFDPIHVVHDKDHQGTPPHNDDFRNENQKLQDVHEQYSRTNFVDGHDFGRTFAEEPKPAKPLVRNTGRPKLKMPQRVREGGVVMNANQGTVELPLLNASPELVEVSVCVEPHQHGNITTCVTPIYLVIGPGEKAHLTMVRTTSEASESLVVLRAATMGSRPGRATYRVPAHIAQSIMRAEQSTKFSVDRPTMSFYNPCTLATREWSVRLRNGTANEELYEVWISEGCGTLHDPHGNPAFQLVSPSHGIVQPDSFTTIRVSFDGSGQAFSERHDEVISQNNTGHFHGRLNVKIGAQCDFIPLFGFTGGSDIRLRATELGYVCAKNSGDRYGFIVITGPEADAVNNKSEKAVLAPGEEREFVAPYGTGSVVYTGDEIARSRQRRAEKLRRLDDAIEPLDDSNGLCGGEFDGEDSAHEVEVLDWSAEDKFSMFYSGRLLDHNMKRYVFDVNDGDGMGFVETNRASQCGWTVTVEGGYLHLENLEVEKEICFEAEGAEPSCGVIAPLGDAMLAAFRESVDIRAQGRVENIHINLPSAE